MSAAARLGWRRLFASALLALSAIGPANAAEPAGKMKLAAPELTFDIRLTHGRAPDNMQLIRVKEGDVVTLRWTTDQPLVVHLHGYDIETRLVPAAVGKFSFTANLTGRFPIHVHATGEGAAAPTDDAEPLITLEVYPR